MESADLIYVNETPINLELATLIWHILNGDGRQMPSEIATVSLNSSTYSESSTPSTPTTSSATSPASSPIPPSYSPIDMNEEEERVWFEVARIHGNNIPSAIIIDDDPLWLEMNEMDNIIERINARPPTPPVANGINPDPLDIKPELYNSCFENLAAVCFSCNHMVYCRTCFQRYQHVQNQNEGNIPVACSVCRNGAEIKKASKKVDDDDDEEEEDKNDEDAEETDSNTTQTCENLVDSSLPPFDRKQQRIAELQKMKANCKSEDLEQLKTRCEILIRNCIVGLLAQLSDDDFKNMEDELNRAVCWYLTCERYWEDGPIELRAFPWGLVFVLVMVLSLGVCFCYYIIWILFDSDDHLNLQSAISGQNPGHLSPTHHRLNTIAGSVNYHHQHVHPHTVPGVQQVPSTSGNQSGQVAYGEEFYVALDFNDVGQSEHYIYVTYPP